MEKENTPERSTMRSVERALDIVDILVDRGRPLRLAEVARESGLHIATAQRILRVLHDRNYVAKGSAGYTVGASVVAAAYSFLNGNQLALAAVPVLQELADALGLTASLSVRVGSARVLVERIEGTSPLRYQLPIGGRLPLHLGAGKVFLADLPLEERERILTGLGEHIVTAGGEEVSLPDLKSNLDEIAARGYAISRSERVIGAVSVAAPVRSREGVLLGVVQVSGLEEDMTDDRLARATRDVINACSSIAARTQWDVAQDS